LTDENSKKQNWRAALKLAAATTMVALTYLTLQVVDHYDTAATNIIPNLSFEEGGKYWSNSGRGISLKKNPQPVVEPKLATPPSPLILGRSIPDPQRFTHIRVGADIKLINVAPGNLWWEQAGIILRSKNKKNQKIKFWPKTVISLSGARDWTRYERVIPVPGNARNMQLVIFLDGHSGAMEVSNISLDAVAPSAWFQVTEYALIVAWALIGLWVVAPLLSSAPRKIVALFALSTFLATLVTVLTPQPTLSITTARTINASIALVQSIAPKRDVTFPDASEQKSVRTTDAAPDEPRSKKAVARKKKTVIPFNREFTRLVGMTPKQFTAGGGSGFSHVVSHAAFSFLVALAFPLATPLLLITALSLAAVTTETLQLFVVTRSSNLEDLGMNILGVFIGLAIIFAWRLTVWRYHRWRRG
jgi:hypothetical protein